MKKEPRYRKLADLGLLHEILIRCSPTNDRNEKSIPTLAAALGVSNMTIYKWINSNSIPAKRANALVTMSAGKVKRTELEKYIYGE